MPVDDTFSAHEATRKRRRWGCTCGCLIFLFTFLLGLGVLLYYGLRPLKAASHDRWMTASINGFAELRADMNDPGFSQIVNLNLRNIEERQKRGLPETEQQAVEKSMTAIRQSFGLAIHPRIPVYVRFDPSTRKESTLAVIQMRFAAAVAIVQALFEAHGHSPVETISGFPVYALRTREDAEPTLFGISKRAAFFSSNRELLAQALELEAGDSTGAPSPTMQRYLDELDLLSPPEGEDLAGVVLNEPRRFRRFLDAVGENVGFEELADNMEAAFESQKTSFEDIIAWKFAVNASSADKAEFGFNLYCKNQAAAANIHGIVRKLLTQLQQADEAGLIEKAESKAQGPTISIIVEMKGLKPWLGNLVPAAEDAATTPAQTQP